jgi:hypothetical protein
VPSSAKAYVRKRTLSAIFRSGNRISRKALSDERRGEIVIEPLSLTATISEAPKPKEPVPEIPPPIDPPPPPLPMPPADPMPAPSSPMQKVYSGSTNSRLPFYRQPLTKLFIIGERPPFASPKPICVKINRMRVVGTFAQHRKSRYCGQVGNTSLIAAKLFVTWGII